MRHRRGKVVGSFKIPTTPTTVAPETQASAVADRDRLVTRDEQDRKAVLHG